MASDVRISVSLPDHPKTKKLIRKLGDGAAWRLVRLFLWASQNRADGTLSGMSVDDLELAVDWCDGEGVFISTLVDVGFLDCIDGVFVIHDWAIHNPWAASAGDRSEASKWAALCKRYGREGAAIRMPDYAARMRDARDARAESCGSLNGAREPDAPSPSPLPSPSPSPLQDQDPFAEGDESPPAGEQPSAKKPKAYFDYDAKLFVNLGDDLITAWAEAYPAIDVRAEITKAKVWLVSNPKNRKSDIPKFLNNWLNRAQDNAPRANGYDRPQPATDRRLAVSEATRNYDKAIDF